MKWIKGFVYTFLAILWLILILSTAAFAVTQTNTSGSNTNISGAYTGGSTTYESGSSSSSTTTNSTTSNMKSAPYTSAAPSLGSMNNCALALSAGVQNFSIGVSAGRHYIDPVCQTINLSKALHGMGMKVAAVSVMCGDERVFAAMMNAGTPCPFDGLVGLPAKEAWSNNEHLIPGHVPGKKEKWDADDKNTAKGASVIGGLFLALLLLL